MDSAENYHNGNSLKSIIGRNILAIIISVAAAMAAYYSTVSSLEVSIASKTDLVQTTNIEKRLNIVENALEKNLISRDDFFRFREEVNYRLLKIELKLEDISKGETDVGKK